MFVVDNFAVVSLKFFPETAGIIHVVCFRIDLATVHRNFLISNVSNNIYATFPYYLFWQSYTKMQIYVNNIDFNFPSTGSKTTVQIEVIITKRVSASYPTQILNKLLCALWVLITTFQKNTLHYRIMPVNIIASNLFYY